jgi:hypothetical protein
VKLAIALVLLVVRCPQPTSAYDAEVVRARDAWAMDGALPPDECGFPSVARQTFHCGGEPCLSGYQYRNDITIHAGLDDAEARYVVRHETVHWLAWCTGHQQWGDPGHSMPELWGASGVLARSEMLP